MAKVYVNNQWLEADFLGFNNDNFFNIEMQSELGKVYVNESQLEKIKFIHNGYEMEGFIIESKKDEYFSTRVLTKLGIIWINNQELQ